MSAITLFIAPTFASYLLLIADKSLALLWYFLSWCASLPIASYHFVFPSISILILTMCAFVLLLAPAGFPGRWLALIWFLPALCYQPERPAVGDVWITLLDVGQGLAVVVQTKTHLLLYDTGPKYASHDMGESVILPYLRTLHIKHIDRLVISHSDNDHSGGAKAILNHLPVRALKASKPEKLKDYFSKFSDKNFYCLAGESWQWDGVKFSFIYPTHENFNLGNDSSCVLRIDNGKERVLLTGDIEKHAEKYLVSHALQLLPANILIAPHHGSKTSIYKPFIHAVHPEFVLYAIGYQNRYHFPHASVIKAYEALQAKQFNTAESGAIMLKLEKQKSFFMPEQYRNTHARYWHFH